MIAALLGLLPLLGPQDARPPSSAGEDLADERAFRSRLSILLSGIAGETAPPPAGLAADLLARAEALSPRTRSEAPGRILAHAMARSPGEAAAILRGDEAIRCAIEAKGDRRPDLQRAYLTEALLAFRASGSAYDLGRAERLLGDLALNERHAGLAEAHYEAAAAHARALDLDGAESAALEGLAEARARAGLDWRGALDRIDALELRRADPGRGEAARLRVGRALIARDESAGAIRVLDEVLSRDERRPLPVAERAEVLSLLGQAALQQLDFARARALLSRAADLLGSDSSDSTRLEIEMGLAEVAIWQARFDEAERRARRASDLAPPDSPVGEDARLIRLRALCLQGRYRDALSVAQEGSVRYTRFPERRRVARFNEALILRSLGRVEEARGILDRLLSDGDFASRARTGVPLHAVIAAIHHDQGLFREAEAHALAAVSLAEGTLEEAGPGVALDFALLRWPYRAFEIGISAMLAQGKAEEAFFLAERSKARGFLVEIARYGPEVLEGAPPALAEEWRAALHRYREIAASHATQPDLVAAERIRAELDRASEAIASAVRRAQAAVGEGLDAPSPATAAAVRARLLEGNRLFLEYFVGEEIVYLFLVGPDTVRTFEIGPPGDVAEVVRDLAGVLRGAFRSARFRDEAGERSARATRLLLPDELPQLLAGREVYLVPDGPLFGLPFESLAGPGGRFLGETTTFAYGFSAGLLSATGDRPVRLERGAVVAGDPVGAGVAPLRHARAEVLAVRDRFPEGKARVLLGSAFTKEALFGQRDPIGVLHLVTHSEGAGERLGLAVGPEGGVLWGEEAIQIGGSPDLVVLSGCGTARGEYVRGLGLRGLLYPLHFSGASRCVASLWPVEDGSVPPFMDAFYRSLWETRSVPVALATARRRFAPGTRAENLPLFFAFLAYGPF